MIPIYILMSIIFILLLYIIITANSLFKLNNKVNEAFSIMDVYLKKRWDLIPNIVSLVKEYSKLENNTLENIVKLRNNLYDNLNLNKKITTNEQLSTNIESLIIKMESYPNLKANESYLDLSEKLSQVEEDIANARKYYNATVRMLNNKVEMFPSSIVAKILNIQTKLMFQAKETEKENITINLGDNHD